MSLNTSALFAVGRTGIPSPHTLLPTPPALALYKLSLVVSHSLIPSVNMNVRLFTMLHCIPLSLVRKVLDIIQRQEQTVDLHEQFHSQVHIMYTPLSVSR